jgi:hypothetical protein
MTAIAFDAASMRDVCDAPRGGEFNGSRVA